MSKIIFNEHQSRALEANPNVTAVSDRTIQYTPDFKVSGRMPRSVFLVPQGFPAFPLPRQKNLRSIQHASVKDTVRR